MFLFRAAGPCKFHQLEFENASQRQVPVGCFNQSVLAFAAAFARRTIYLTKVRTYIFPAIKISDVDQPRNLAKSVTVEWKIPFRRVVVVN